MNKSADDNLKMDTDSTEKTNKDESNDGVTDANDATGDSPTSEEEIEKTEPEEKEAESDRYLRLAAEFDNYKKRTAREYRDLIGRANVELLKTLVEIADNFDRAIAAEASGHNFEAYRKGVELTCEQLTNLLDRENVIPIVAVGEVFDPNCHEAMMQEDSDEYEEGVISKEIQKGYRINDRILRHSRVVVSRGRGSKDNTKENK